MLNHHKATESYQGRSPLGESGLKSNVLLHRDELSESLSTWRVWIEIATIGIFARLQPIQKSHNVLSCVTIIIKLNIL